MESGCRLHAGVLGDGEREFQGLCTKWEIDRETWGEKIARSYLELIIGLFFNL